MEAESKTPAIYFQASITEIEITDVLREREIPYPDKFRGLALVTGRVWLRQRGQTR